MERNEDVLFIVLTKVSSMFSKGSQVVDFYIFYGNSNGRQPQPLGLK